MMQSLRKTAAARSILGSLVLLAGCGESDPIDNARGDWVFVNYWATWCEPCRREIPELNSLHAESGYTVLGVNYDGSSGETLAEEEAALSIGFPTLALDPAQRYGVARPQVLPTTLVIDPQGKLLEVRVGPQTEASLRALAGEAAGKDMGKDAEKDAEKDAGETAAPVNS